MTATIETKTQEPFGIHALRRMTPGGRKRVFRFANYGQFDSARANARRIRRECPREDGWVYDFTCLADELLIVVKLLPPGAQQSPEEGEQP